MTSSLAVVAGALDSLALAVQRGHAVLLELRWPRNSMAARCTAVQIATCGFVCQYFPHPSTRPLICHPVAGTGPSRHFDPNSVEFVSTLAR